MLFVHVYLCLMATLIYYRPEAYVEAVWGLPAIYLVLVLLYVSFPRSSTARKIADIIREARSRGEVEGVAHVHVHPALNRSSEWVDEATRLTQVRMAWTQVTDDDAVVRWTCARTEPIVDTNPILYTNTTLARILSVVDAYEKNANKTETWSCASADVTS